MKNQRDVFNALFSGLINEKQQQPSNNWTRRVSFNLKLRFLYESFGKIKRVLMLNQRFKCKG